MSVYLGLGSNLGDRERNLLDAIERLGEEVVVQQISSPYDTEPVGYDDQPRFLNAVVKGETKLPPDALLKFVKKIEVDLGRAASFINAPRLIDIDILLYDDVVIDTPSLTIPHSRYAERAFVLVPLVEIASEVVCPVRQKSVRELADMLDSNDGIVSKEWTRR
ncbi:MAG: 2-amino-4-hydroxy-6-hydroxymethyldihydropteridine diphosphokinase [Anaerolineales bacterium]|jgi:2-amino-4-hydroxy-6-hydroxymethyldihydropteridine diphosphokinase|nr:2-amino-4-hydroxy-6-hydroxymethyldihydropteridine diphosphokinase [Anaerolineales bacterium]